MAILYPPYIEGKLPAQHGQFLNIPFQMNRAVGVEEISGIKALIKNISTNTLVTSLISDSSRSIFTTNESMAVFDLQDIKLQIGQYYKIQLAEVNSSIYSTVGIFKYTITPQVTIQGLQEGINNSLGTYIGIYSNVLSETLKDTSEKVHEYQFDLLLDGQIIETSGRCIHDFQSDSIAENETYDTHYFKTTLLDGFYYQVRYTVYTNNNLVIASPLYSIRKAIPYKKIYDFSLEAVADDENGLARLYLVTESNTNIMGHFRLCRAEATDNFALWHEIDDFVFDTKLNGSFLVYEDFTVEHGVKYKYACYQLSNNLMTEMVETNIIQVDFEDAFLFDGKKQLKLKFNPKIASFKNNLLEQKLDTIGSKYPFVFRNANTNYKEFTISALISLLMDENFYFADSAPLKEINRTNTPEDKSKTEINLFTTNLTSNNYFNERNFKLQVLDWLTNGEVKLFRSPAEGNYIVRLINTSLTPNDTLGRLLHTFTSTAYEFDKNDFATLKQYGFVREVFDQIDTTHFQIIHMQDYQTITTISMPNITYLKITEATPGATVKFQLTQGQTVDIVIGPSGTYQFPIDINNPLAAITVDPQYQGTVEIGHIGQANYKIVDTVEISGFPVELVLNSIEYIEKCRRFNIDKDKNGNPQSIELMNKIIPQVETIGQNLYNRFVIDNIIMLRLDTDDEYNISPSDTISQKCIIKLKDPDTDEIITQSIDLSQSILLDNGSKTKGYIKYQVTKSNPKFIPISIVVSSGIIVDIYYSAVQYGYISAEE